MNNVCRLNMNKNKKISESMIFIVSISIGFSYFFLDYYNSKKMYRING